MRESLLEVLREPRTGARLALTATQWERDVIQEGELRSEATGKTYPVVRGVPRFVERESYAASFGLQWNAFRETQLDSRRAGSISEKRLWGETGWKPETIAGKLVLDAGCGAGRFAEVAAAAGARVIGLDISSAADAAAQTLARYPHAEVIQGSVLEPPLAKESFEYAYCIGVIQHTPAPADAIAEIVRLVRKGGEFGLTIYGRRPWTKLNAKYLVRPLTKRIKPQTMLRVVERVVPAVFPVADALFRVPVLGSVARFSIPIAIYEEPGATRQARVEEAVLDTFDMLTPAYDNPMTAREVERVLRRENVASWAFPSRIPVVVRGVR